MKIIATSDLHLELTGPKKIIALVEKIAKENPQAVLLAGDIGNPASDFKECISLFKELPCPVGIVAGNHDLWCQKDESSVDLYYKILPKITRSFGFHWLDEDIIKLEGGVAICGNIAWYDYSAREPSYKQTDLQILQQKPNFAMDATRMDWDLTDQEFAATCKAKSRSIIQQLEDDSSITQIVFTTHVPLYENQMMRKPEDAHWSLGNPYFGHMTMGDDLLRFEKLRCVISGHTHVGMQGIVKRHGKPPIATHVLGSDYGSPVYITIDTEDFPQ